MSQENNQDAKEQFEEIQPKEELNSTQNQNLNTTNNDYNSLEETIKDLEIKEKEASKNCNYEEAEALNKKIKHLRDKIKKGKKRDLALKHQQEMENLEALYKKELNDLETEFQEKVNLLDSVKQQNESSLVEKQSTTLEIQQTKLQEKLQNVKLKPSKTFFELKSQESNLARQKNYAEARLIHSKGEEQEQEDIKKFDKNKKDKLDSTSNKFNTLFSYEKSNLKAKYDLEYSELVSQKNISLGVIHKKYKNKKQELETQHKMEEIVIPNDSKFKAGKIFI